MHPCTDEYKAGMHSVPLLYNAMSSTSSGADDGGHYEYRLKENLNAALGTDLIDLKDLVLEQCLSIDASKTELEAIQLYRPPGGRALGQCLCGKQGIIQHNIIRHVPTGILFVVGSQCVKRFITPLWPSAQHELVLWNKCAKLQGSGPSSSEYNFLRMECLRQAMAVAKDRGRVVRPDERAPTIRAHGAAGDFTLTCASVAGARAHLSVAAALIRGRQAYQPHFGDDAVDATIARGLRSRDQVRDHVRLMMAERPDVMPPATWEPALAEPDDWDDPQWSPADGCYAAPTCVARCACGATLSRAELLRPGTPRVCHACFAKPLVALSLLYPSCGSVAVCLSGHAGRLFWPTDAFMKAHNAGMKRQVLHEAGLPPDARIRMNPPPSYQRRGEALPALPALDDMTWTHPCPMCGEARIDRVHCATQLRGVLDKACHLCETRAYFAVPYARKEDAKRIGARWDSVAYQWYVNVHGDVEGMRRLFGAPVPRRAPAR